MNRNKKESARIRVLLVDDQRLMRDGLRTLLELEDDIEVAGEAENGILALEMEEALRPDVVLMDVRMPEMDGVEATRQMMARREDTKVIILTTFDDESIIFDGLRAGALGYLLKDVSGMELAEAIRKVMQGGALIEPSVARKVLAEFSRLPVPQTTRPVDTTAVALSTREEEILGWIARGLSNKEIALRLSLTEGTVKNYVSGILQKLDVQDRTQAALMAREMGIIR
ncbi:MAG: response regulator transcription factor [Leptolinea sp.]|nr:response regulator transcription factor [Leptolinea sp.]